MTNESENKDKRSRENKDFVMLYRENMDNITNLAKTNAKAFDLLMFFIKHMDGTNALLVSNVALMEFMGCSRMTINRAVKHLKEEGWICVLKTGTSNVYIVNPDIAWTSYANQKQYCKFNTTAFISGTENNEYLNNRNAFTKFKAINEDFIKNAQKKKEDFLAQAEDMQQRA